jgi:transposase-like protein
VVKNGKIHNGKQNHKCRGCGRQFVESPQWRKVSDETKALIDKLLLEKLPLAGIARVVGVSEPWLQGYVNETFGAVKREVAVRKKRPPHAAVR